MSATKITFVAVMLMQLAGKNVSGDIADLSFDVPAVHVRSIHLVQVNGVFTASQKRSRQRSKPSRKQLLRLRYLQIFCRPQQLEDGCFSDFHNIFAAALCRWSWTTCSDV